MVLAAQIVFTADNGGPTTTGDGVGARNWPLRGGKHSVWEGGTRVTGIISGHGAAASASPHFILSVGNGTGEVEAWEKSGRGGARVVVGGMHGLAEVLLLHLSSGANLPLCCRC